MAESSTINREEIQPWPFLYMLGAVAVIVALAVAWFYLRSADTTLLLFGGLAVVGLVLLALYVAIAVWVYNDAKQIGVPAALWTIVVIFWFVIGLGVYLLMREFRPSQWPGNQ